MHQSTEGGLRGKMALLYNIKPTWEMESYMNSGNSETVRIIFNFRASNHTMPVERLRYVGVPRNKRWCGADSCRNKHVGDELHAFACPKNRDKIIELWKMIINHPGCADLIRKNVRELLDDTLIPEAWSSDWLVKWEYDIRLAAETCLKLNTKIVVKFLRQYWYPFKLYYTT